MTNNHDDTSFDDDRLPAWQHPTKAQDMLGLTAHYIRDMLTSGSHDNLYETYGILPREAVQSLRYVELAELRAWGIDEMIEVTLPGQSSTVEHLRRRIVLAMKAEHAPDFIHPGDAVLLLERSGLMLVGELRDAVVSMSTCSNSANGIDFSLENQNRLRRLLGMESFTDAEARVWTAESDDEMTGEKGTLEISRVEGKIKNSWGAQALQTLQYEAIQQGMTHAKLAEKYQVTRQFISQLLKKANDELGTRKAMPFDALTGGRRK